MIRAAAALLALAGVAVGCASLGDGGDDVADRVAPPRARDITAAIRPPRPRAREVIVTVVNGDTRTRVRGARVTIGRRSDVTNRRGEARVPIRRRAALPVTVRARGYRTKTVRLPFRRRPKAGVRIYRSALQWPLYGADPARTQAHDAIRLRPPFRIVWTRGVGSLLEFPAVVSDGIAYIGNYRGTIHAIEMRRGKPIWRYDPPGGKMASSPAVVGDELVVHGMDGVVRVLDRRNGRLRWQRRIGSPIESSPVVRDGVDYFGAWDGRVYALDLRTRRLRWVYPTGAKITSSAALAGRTRYIGDYAARVLALDAWTGRLRWSRQVNGRVYGTPAVAYGRVFVPSSTGRSLTAFSTGGRYLWRVTTGNWVYSSPAVWAGRVFFGSYDGYLYAVSVRRGRVLWRVAAGGPVSGAAAVVAGVVYAGSTANRIVAADARNGRVLLRFPHGEYVPVSGNGGRLLLHGYSRLYAVEPRRP